MFKKDIESLVDCLRVLQGVYSEYIHGKASSIMWCYDQEKHQFLTNGANVKDIDGAIENFWILAYVADYVVYTGRSWMFGRDYWLHSSELAKQFGQFIGMQEQ